MWILQKGLRRGIERISRWIMPALLAILLVLMVRALTLGGAGAGVHWYLLKFEPEALTPTVALAAMGQAVFTLSLGGTFMVVYGSYLPETEPLRSNAAFTAAGDTLAGLLAGLVVFPLVFAFGAEPASGPGLLFSTLPALFARMPLGAVFGFLFFAGLFFAAFLSDIAALEVLVAGLCDRLGWSRRQAARRAAALVFLLALPPMTNMRIFVPWDLTFGSGLQTFGALLAAVTVGWIVRREKAVAALGLKWSETRDRWFYYWLKFTVPTVISLIAVWWLFHDVF